MKEVSTKTQVTREEITKLFGNMTVEEAERKLKEAEGIISKYGIHPETFLIKAHDCKNGEELKGSMYVAKAIRRFCFE